MGYLIMAILSYPASYIFRELSTMVISKDLCKRGYKFSKRNIATSNMNYFDALRFVPILNVALDGSYLIEDLFNKVRVENYIDSTYVERMTREELDSFKNDPSMLNAYLINMRSLTDNAYENKKKKKTAVIAQEMKIDEENIIYYNVDMLASSNGVSIVSAKGEISKYSNEALTDIVESYYDELNARIEEYVNTYYDGDYNKFKEALFENNITEQIREEIDINEIKNKILRKYI